MKIEKAAVGLSGGYAFLVVYVSEAGPLKSVVDVVRARLSRHGIRFDRIDVEDNLVRVWFKVVPIRMMSSPVTKYKFYSLLQGVKSILNDGY